MFFPTTQKKIRIVCIIPARLHSTRFPKKILSNLAGKPLLGWIWDAAKKTKLFDDVLFAIDAQETAASIEKFSGAYLMTSPSCASGTDRLIEVIHSGKIDADIWVNWQADEPFITSHIISQLLSTCNTNDADVWTLKKQIPPKEASSPNVVKVVCDINNYALYFSRSQIPFYRDDFVGERVFYKHVGLYAYTTEALKCIKTLQTSNLEGAEKLEQLRFLQNGLKIKVHETDQDVFGIDVPKDLEKAEEKALSNNL